MFIVLNPEKPANGFISARKQKRRLAASTPVSHSTVNGLPFFTLDILAVKNGTVQNEIEEKCGRYVSRIVAPRSLHLPDNGRIKRFTPGASSGIFLFNTVLGIIDNVSPEPTGICITVIDRNAVMCGEISRLLPFTSSLRVITAHPERYAAVCEKIYGDCGASVVVRSVYQPTEKKEIVICCDGATTPGMSESAVFSYKRGIHGKLRFFSQGIKLSDDHEKTIPGNIDSVDFASAVTELCGSTEYKLSCYSDTQADCSRCSDSDAAKCLECYISRSCEIK